MRFALFMPPRVPDAELPLLMFLAGLTCTEETFTIKAGAQRVAAELGIALLMPDTSPRGANIPGESDSWDFGVGAGFYLDATREPWSKHWRIESYLMRELLPLVIDTFAIDSARVGILGHSMGGHGALTLALKYPGRFNSVSAFAPIAAPMRAPWGRKAFAGYLGDDTATWADHDASELMTRQNEVPVSARYSDRSGTRRSISDGTVASRGPGGCVPQGRAAANASLSRRLRSQLLLHLDLRRRPSAFSSRKNAAFLTAQFRSRMYFAAIFRSSTNAAYSASRVSGNTRSK